MTSKTSRSSFTRDLHVIPSLLLRVVPHFRFAVVPNFNCCIIARTAFYWLCVQSGLPHGGFAYVLDAQTCQQIGDALVDCTAHSSLRCECAVPNIAASLAYSAFASPFLESKSQAGRGVLSHKKRKYFPFLSFIWLLFSCLIFCLAEKRSFLKIASWYCLFFCLLAFVIWLKNR